jgi:hypothetical protein
MFESLMVILYKDINYYPKDFFIKGKELAQKLNALRQKDPENIVLIKKELSEIGQLLDGSIIKTEDIPELLSSWKGKDWISHIMVVLLGLPVFIYALVNHIVANIVPWTIEKLAGFHIIYRSTMKMLIGLVSYLVFYTIQLLFIWSLYPHLYILVIYVISLVMSGLCFFPYLKWLKRLICHGKALFIPLSVNKELKNKILTLKNLIYN